MRDKVLEIVKENGYVHLGLGCILNSSNPDRDIRTLFNACSQYWSILTLLTINKLHSLIDINGYTEDIKVISTIYDSIYILIKCNPILIQWLNMVIIPLLTKDYLDDIIVHNVAIGEIGFNWSDTVQIKNNSSILEIRQAIEKAKEIEK